jgi:hypothetical protein
MSWPAMIMSRLCVKLLNKQHSMLDNGTGNEYENGGNNA